MSAAKNNTRPKATSRSMAPIPIEWMGPPAWRLPSGKALAEFALQSGFLAPLMLGGVPFWRRAVRPSPPVAPAVRNGILRGSRNGINQ